VAGKALAAKAVAAAGVQAAAPAVAKAAVPIMGGVVATAKSMVAPPTPSDRGSPGLPQILTDSQAQGVLEEHGFDRATTVFSGTKVFDVFFVSSVSLLAAASAVSVFWSWSQRRASDAMTGAADAVELGTCKPSEPRIAAAALVGEAEAEAADHPGLPRRSQLLAAAVGGSACLNEAQRAAAFGSLEEEKFDVQAKSKGLRPYVFVKPKGFKQFANPADPSGYIFRDTEDTYYSFITRSEEKPNANKEFTPEFFIKDYEEKFVESIGSSFKLIKGGGKPNRVDEKLGISYYEIEYIVRTQLGFAFDSLRTLHFITVIAAAPESIYICNCQAQDDTWEKNKQKLRQVADSFKITGDVAK
jgi:hypothetical protein